MPHDPESPGYYEVALVQDHASGDFHRAESAVDTISRDFRPHLRSLDLLFLEPSLLVVLLRFEPDTFSDELARQLAMDARQGSMRVLKPTLLSARERERFVRERLGRFTFRERGVRDVPTAFAALRAHVEDKRPRVRSGEGRLSVWFADEAELLHSLRDDELFVPSRAFPPLGTRLRMAVELGSGQGPIALNGRVIDIERGADAVGTLGFTVELDVSPARRGVFDGFLSAVRNRAPWSGGRQEQRADVRLPVEYLRHDSVRREYTTSLSRVGLFVESADPPSPGTRLTMRLFAVGRTRGVQLLGRVTHVMTRAKAAATGATPGMGVQFEEPDRTVCEKLESIVGSIEEPQPVRVLVVDDDRLFRVMLTSVFADAGFTVLEAADGDEALTKIMDCLVDLQLLILDLTMPGLSGQELVEMVRSVGGQDELIVVVVTGAELTEEETSQLEKLGADVVVSKRDAPEGVVERACALLAARA